MKNLVLTLMIGAMAIVSSCSSTNKAKIAHDSQKMVRGDWTLTSIVSDQDQSVVVTELFDQASMECFEGSSWNFIANNNSGSYTLNGAGCPSNENEIKWYIEDDQMGNNWFFFKRVEEGEKARKVDTGYKMRLVSVDETSMHLLHEIPFEGGNMNLHYHFSK